MGFVVTVVGASALAVLLGLGPGPLDAIVGGEPVIGDAYRSTVLVDRGIDLCTGTLLTPRVVLTAAHCIAGAPPEQLQVRVGNARDAAEHVLGVMAREEHPDFCSGLIECGEDLHDFAYLELSDPAPADAVVPALPLDQATWDAAVRAGSPVAVVGFGRDDEGQQGVKRMVEVPIRGTTATGLEFLAGQDGKDGCQGDSGGPAYARLADGTEVLVGVGSRGLACGEGGYFGIAPTALCWIDQELGLGFGGACDIDPDPAREDSEGCRLGPEPSSGASLWVLAMLLFRRRRAAATGVTAR